jgi:hypothetical protein
MDTQTTAAVVVASKWLWDKYGKELSDSAVDKLKTKWKEFKWDDACAIYCEHLKDICSTIHVLGNPKPIKIDELYTDVHILDKPTAFQRFDIQELKDKQIQYDMFQLPDEKRKPALRVVLNKKRIFILGKPGAGKTTLLKYLVLTAIDKKNFTTPIFISLKEWSDSKLDLLDFIISQFEICAFPDPKSFIFHLLKSGRALVLFDGLDEVNTEGNQREKMIRELTDFSKSYPDIHICLTCRVATTDYSFDQFEYIEISDFDIKQQNIFIKKWYHDSNDKLIKFQTEFKKPENKGLRELARTPLLLALLCLAFDETLSFPPRKIDLYEEAIDALLKKWDSSRGIKRDEIYKKLSPARKEQMLGRIAAVNFSENNYFMPQKVVETQIIDYFRQLPDIDESEDVDGEVILKAIENQHGILVERAHKIYSFSHLTFQEYFTARYIVENIDSGTLKWLLKKHISNNRWREIILMTASMLDKADNFFSIIIDLIKNNVKQNHDLFLLFQWAVQNVKNQNHDEDVEKYIPAYILFALLIKFNKNIFLFKPTFGKFNKDKGGFFGLEIQGDDLLPSIYVFSADSDLIIHFPYHFVYSIASELTNIDPSQEIVQSFDSKLGELMDPLEFLYVINNKRFENNLNPLIKFDKKTLIALGDLMQIFENYISCLNLATVTNRKQIKMNLFSIFF